MISDAYDDFQSESLKVSEMVEAVMISDYRADVETSLSLAKVLMLMLNITDADAEETDKADAECKYLLTGTNIFSAKKINSVQDEVFHIMDSIMRDREDCYVVRNSAVGSPMTIKSFQFYKEKSNPEFEQKCCIFIYPQFFTSSNCAKYKILNRWPQ